MRPPEIVAAHLPAADHLLASLVAPPHQIFLACYWRGDDGEEVLPAAGYRRTRLRADQADLRIAPRELLVLERQIVRAKCVHRVLAAVPHRIGLPAAERHRTRPVHAFHNPRQLRRDADRP